MTVDEFVAYEKAALTVWARYMRMIYPRGFDIVSQDVGRRMFQEHCDKAARHAPKEITK